MPGLQGRPPVVDTDQHEETAQERISTALCCLHGACIVRFVRTLTCTMGTIEGSQCSPPLEYP